MNDLMLAVLKENKASGVSLKQSLLFESTKKNLETFVLVF